MNKFKTIDYSIIEDDDFIIEAKKILELKSAKVSGSYLRYGKEKACDLDLSEKLDFGLAEIKETLPDYFKKLKSYKSDIILVRLSFDIIDNSIQKLINNLGNLNGMLQIENSNINENQIESTLPTTMKKEIKNLILKYNKTNDVFNYVNLYMYLKKNIQPTFTLDEAIKGEITFNGKKIKLYESNFSYMYIELIYKEFRISNFIYFKSIPKQDTTIWNVELNEVLINNLDENAINKYQMSYYKLLKYFFHFLKQSYFKKVFVEPELANTVIQTYNEIYDFRERIGMMNNNLCKLENIIEEKKEQITDLKKNYKELKQQFESKCKNYFIQISKPFYKYLKSNFKLI